MSQTKFENKTILLRVFKSNVKKMLCCAYHDLCKKEKEGLKEFSSKETKSLFQNIQKLNLESMDTSMLIY